MEEEVWKIWKKTKRSLWEVSSFGNVKRNRQIYQPKIKKGYYTFGGWGVHVAVATLFVPKPESTEKLEVGHKDGNPLNNRADNLEWVTHKENCNHPITIKRRLGKPKSEDTKAKIREAMKGKHLSKETKEKISCAVKGEKNGMYGKQHTDEAKSKISEASKKDWQKRKQKTI